MLYRGIMITVGMNYKVLVGKEAIFERAYHQVLAVMEKMEGHARSQLFKEVGEIDNYLILSEWTDQTAFEDFVKSEAFAKVTNWGKESVLAARPQHTIYK